MTRVDIIVHTYIHREHNICTYIPYCSIRIYGFQFPNAKLYIMSFIQGGENFSFCEDIGKGCHR